MAERLLPDWIEGFMEYTERALAPEHYRRWGAYSVLSGVVERRIWSAVSGRPCYPNLFVLLVAEPGVGKTVTVDEALKMWTGCKGIRIAPSGMTKAAFIDHINEKDHSYLLNGYPIRYHTLTIASGEFGTLCPDYDLTFLNVLNDMYDCRDLYEDRTRKDGLKIVERPHVNFLAGTQPAYLKHILPDTAFGMGFSSRIIMVYGAEVVEYDMFDEYDEDKDLFEKLILDLRDVQRTVGPQTPSEEGRAFISDWYKTTRHVDRPTHGLLRSYCVRRHIHVQKLAMISAISRGECQQIERQDYERALELLLSAEHEMPQIFKEMAASPDARELDEIYIHVKLHCNDSEDGYISESDLMEYIARRVPVSQSDYFLKMLLQTKRIALAGAAVPGNRKFKPLERKAI